MTVFLPEHVSPLAYDANGENFALPERAVGWRVTRANGKPGRPRLVITEHGPLHLSFGTTYEQFCEAVAHQTGEYRLYPVDSCGKMLDPVAYVEISEKRHSTEELMPRDEQHIKANGPVWGDGAPEQVFDLCKQMLASRDAHDVLMAQMMTTLVTQVALMQEATMKQTAAMQQSMAGLLTAASQTIKVANGVQALERPELSIEELSDKLRGALAPVAPEAKPATPWYEALLSGPMGAMLIQFISNFAMGMQQAAQAQMLANVPAETQGDPAQECPASEGDGHREDSIEDEADAPQSGGNTPHMAASRPYERNPLVLPGRDFELKDEIKDIYRDERISLETSAVHHPAASAPLSKEASSPRGKRLRRRYRRRTKARARSRADSVRGKSPEQI